MLPITVGIMVLFFNSVTLSCKSLVTMTRTNAVPTISAELCGLLKAVVKKNRFSTLELEDRQLLNMSKNATNSERNTRISPSGDARTICLGNTIRSTYNICRYFLCHDGRKRTYRNDSSSCSLWSLYRGCSKTARAWPHDSTLHSEKYRFFKKNPSALEITGIIIYQWFLVPVAHSICSESGSKLTGEPIFSSHFIGAVHIYSAPNCLNA